MNASALPLSSHLSDLRTLILKSTFIIACGVGISFLFYEPLIHVLTAPYRSIAPNKEIKLLLFRNDTHTERTLHLPKNGHVKQLYKGSISEDLVLLSPGGILEISQETDPYTLVFLSPLEGFRVALWVSFLTGLLLTFPLWSLLIFRFILPGLHPEEKATLLPLGVLSLFFLTAALFIAHTFTIPWMNHALLAFNQSLGSNFWGVESYLDYVLGLYLAHAALFEISLLLLFFVYKGWISTHHFTNGRKGAYLTAFILGAFLTPPDVFSQLCVAVPLIILFEIAAFWASLKRTV